MMRKCGLGREGNILDMESEYFKEVMIELGHKDEAIKRRKKSIHAEGTATAKSLT